jgi:hypothetical protein
VKDAFGGSGVLDKLGILENLDVSELRELMNKGVRDRIVDEDGETLASMASAAPVSACQGKAVRAALDKTFQLAGVGVEQLGVEGTGSQEMRQGVVEEVAARALDMQVIAAAKGTGVAGSWAASTVLAAFEDKKFRPKHVIRALERRQQHVFADERPEALHPAREARKLLTRRLQRAMADQMDAASRPELIRELTKEYRKRFEEEQEGGVVGGCTVEEFEEIVERFIGLGARELTIRADEEREREQEQAEQEGMGERSEMTSAGGESDRPAKRQRTERYEAMTDVSGGDSEVEAVVTLVVPSREVWS